MAVHRNDDKKKLVFLKAFSTKNRFYWKLFWISYQWRYTKMTIENKNINFKKDIFVIEDHFHKTQFRKSYQRRYTGTIIKNKNLNFKNDIFWYRRSFTWKIILKIVSVAVHRNDDQKQKIKLFEIIFYWKIFSTKIYSGYRINGGTQERRSKTRTWLLLKIFDWEWSFIHGFILNIVSIGVHRNDDQKFKTLNFISSG